TMNSSSLIMTVVASSARPGEVAVPGQQSEPGEQVLGGHCLGQPRLVDLELVRRNPADTGVLVDADRVPGAGVHPVPAVTPSDDHVQARLTPSTRTTNVSEAGMAALFSHLGIQPGPAQV